MANIEQIKEKSCKAGVIIINYLFYCVFFDSGCSRNPIKVSLQNAEVEEPVEEAKSLAKSQVNQSDKVAPIKQEEVVRSDAQKSQICLEEEAREVLKKIITQEGREEIYNEFKKVKNGYNVSIIALLIGNQYRSSSLKELVEKARQLEPKYLAGLVLTPLHIFDDRFKSNYEKLMGNVLKEALKRKIDFKDAIFSCESHSQLSLIDDRPEIKAAIIVLSELANPLQGG